MTLRGEQNMYWFLFCPENCMSCVRLREEREGKPPQVKQLFRDEIIVWLHLFTPMAQRDSAKLHNWLCYLNAPSIPVYKDIFLRVRLRDILSGSWPSTIQVIGCLLPIIRNSFWMCQLKETYDVCMRWKQLRSTSLMLKTLVAPLLLSGACISVAFGGNSLLYFHFIWECTLNNQSFWYLGTCLFYRDVVDCYRWWKCVISVLHRCGSGSEFSRESLLKVPNVSS